jgi:hypothetical protein
MEQTTTGCGSSLVPIVDLSEHGLRARAAGTACHLRWPEQ